MHLIGLEAFDEGIDDALTSVPKIWPRERTTFCASTHLSRSRHDYECPRAATACPPGLRIGFPDLRLWWGNSRQHHAIVPPGPGDGCHHAGNRPPASWRTGIAPRDTDGVWAPHWYDSVWRSTGFGPYREQHQTALPPELEPLAERCQPFYEEMSAHRLTP